MATPAVALDDEPTSLEAEVAEPVVLQEIEEAEPADMMTMFDSLLELALSDGSAEDVATFVLHHLRRHRDEYPDWLVKLVLDADTHKKGVTAEELHDLVEEHIRDKDQSKSARQSATDSTLAPELATPDEGDQKSDEQGQVATRSRFHNFSKPLLLGKYLQLHADGSGAVHKSMTDKEIANLLFAVDPTTNQAGLKSAEIARRLSQSDLIKKLTADLPGDTTTADVLSMWASSTKPPKPTAVPIFMPPLEPLSPKDLPLIRPKQKKRATSKKQSTGHVFASTPLKSFTSDFYTKHKNTNTGLSAASNLTTSQRGMSETSQFVGRVLGLRTDWNQGEKFATQGPFTPYNKRSWNAVHPERKNESLLRDVFHRFGVRPGVRNTDNSFHVPDSRLKSALSALDSSSTNVDAVDTLLSTMYQARDLSGSPAPLVRAQQALEGPDDGAPLLHGIREERPPAEGHGVRLREPASGGP